MDSALGVFAGDMLRRVRRALFLCWGCLIGVLMLCIAVCCLLVFCLASSFVMLTSTGASYVLRAAMTVLKTLLPLGFEIRFGGVEGAHVRMDCL